MKNNILSKKYLINYFFYAINFNDLVRNKTLNLFSIGILFISLLFFLSSCKNKDNIVSPKQEIADTTWVQCQGLPEAIITGFAESGNNLVAGSYISVLSEAYIYISFDNGYTWKLDTTFHVNNHSPNNHLYLGTPVTFFVKGQYLFAGIGGANIGNIYISTNDGISWSDKGISWPKGDTTFGGEDINCFTAVGESIFTGTNNGVFRSTDNGMYWSPVNKGLPVKSFNNAPQVMRIVNQGTNIFAGTTTNGIFISNNNGMSWTAINNGLSSLAIYGLTVTGTSVFAGAFPFTSDSIGGVFLYTDNGANWSAVNNGLTDHRINDLASSGEYLFAGANSGLFLSTNGGNSWSYDSIGTPPLSIGIVSLAVINSHLYVGTFYGAWRYPISRLTSAINIKANLKSEK